MTQGTQIQLSDHFTFGRLIRFTLPSMLMMIISSIYCVVDGIMVSNYVGTTAFAALNLIWPFVAVIGSFGFMMGTGGSALVAKRLGEKREEEARSIFSLITYTTIAIAVTLGILGRLFVRDVAILLGAEGELVELCCEYADILLLMMPSYMLQVFYQSLMVTAERPKMGMWITIAAGVMNMLLDVLFIYVFHWGLRGAAWATALSQCIGAIIPLCYFIYCRNKATLYLGKTHLDFYALRKVSSNGISEFVMNISLSIVSMLYMYKLLAELGENGVSAYGVIMYYAFIFVAVFLGFGIGSAPAISYHYGAKNHDELHSLFVKSLTIVGIAGLLITALAQILSIPLSKSLVGYDHELFDLSVRAFRIYAIHFLVTGFNCYASAFFTALNNGPISALISMLRTIVFEAGCVIVVPILFGIESIWWSVTIAESITLLVTIFLFIHFRKRYDY